MDTSKTNIKYNKRTMNMTQQLAVGVKHAYCPPALSRIECRPGVLLNSSGGELRFGEEGGAGAGYNEEDIIYEGDF